MDSPLVDYDSDDGRLTFFIMGFHRWFAWIFLTKEITGVQGFVKVEPSRC
jgi:hypothetical protein